MTIGQRIRNRRKELGITQTQLTEALGYANKSSVCRMESGEWVPSYKILSRVAGVLQCTPQDLIGQPEERTIMTDILGVLGQMDDEHLEKVLSYARFVYMEQASRKE